MKFCKINEKSYVHREIHIKKWLKLTIAHQKATPAPSMVNLSKHKQNFSELVLYKCIDRVSSTTVRWEGSPCKIVEESYRYV